MRYIILLSVVSAAPVSAQTPTGRIINMPPGRAIYYQDPSGLINLPQTTILPYHHVSVRAYLNLGGHDNNTAEVPGARAALSISNKKPSFYVNGYPSGTRLYLMRANEKQDYRQLPMRYSANFSEWSRISPKDLTELEVQPVAFGLITITPRSDLSPGEYIILTTPDREFRAIQLVFEFSLQ